MHSFKPCDTPAIKNYLLNCNSQNVSWISILIKQSFRRCNNIMRRCNLGDVIFNGANLYKEKQDANLLYKRHILSEVRLILFTCKNISKHLVLDKMRLSWDELRQEQTLSPLWTSRENIINSKLQHIFVSLGCHLWLLILFVSLLEKPVICSCAKKSKLQTFWTNMLHLLV